MVFSGGRVNIVQPAPRPGAASRSRPDPPGPRPSLNGKPTSSPRGKIVRTCSLASFHPGRPPILYTPLARPGSNLRLGKEVQLSKAPFINPEWSGILERASRAASGFAALEDRFLNLETFVMASYEDLKREVFETRDSVKTIVGKVAEVSAALKEAQAKLEAGVVVDYSDLAAELDAAQAEIAGAVNPTPVIEEVAKDPSVLEPVVDAPPAEPMP